MQRDTQATKARPKRLAHDERRKLIIETTLACLARDGVDGTSLRSVCRALEVAPSLIEHFFDGWHGLLTASYQYLTERFMAQLAPILEMKLPDAHARMDQVIARYLSTDWIGEHTIGANIAFWQLSRTVVDLRPHFTRFLRDRNKLLRAALAELARERGRDIDITELTTTFTLMLDGIWLERSTNPGSLSDKRIVHMCWFWLDAVLPPPPRPRAKAR
ncbi:MAG TPA: TetR family transcriptional regulator C-terminal domain-containing protein [Acetobacteraceae bacterium]|nr:TetR family transcriptional regulator C-terminal domain-containing protein [Acetobacteraceae bacterium]